MNCRFWADRSNVMGEIELIRTQFCGSPPLQTGSATEGMIFFDHMNFITCITFTVADINIISTTYTLYVSAAFLPAARIYR